MTLRCLECGSAVVDTPTGMYCGWCDARVFVVNGEATGD